MTWSGQVRGPIHPDRILLVLENLPFRENIDIFIITSVPCVVATKTKVKAILLVSLIF